VIGIVIVGHGGLAKEYLSAMEHVVGKQAGVVAISTTADCDRQAKRDEIVAAANSVDQGDGVVVVTDMYGGSPSNLSIPACCKTDRKILYGANLPMLVKLAKSRHKSIDAATKAATAAGRKYIDCIDGSREALF